MSKYGKKIKGIVRDAKDNPEKYCTKTNCVAYGKNPMAFPCSVCKRKIAVDLYLRK